MANNKFTIVVEATDRGSLKLMANEVNRLGGSVREADKATRGATKGAKDLDYTMNSGVRGTANSTRSFSKLAETIGRSGSSGLVGAYATLAANTFAVTAAFNALRSASQVEQIFRGLEAAGIRTGRSLTSTANGLKEVTGNAISTEQALRATAQITSAGFGSDAVERLGKAARDTSFALGRNMTDSLERLSRGVVKLEPELLDELGIMTKITESNVLYAAQLGKTESQLTNFEKRQGFLNAVLNEAELKFGGLAEAAGNSTSYDRLAAKLSDLSNNVLNVVNVITKPLAGALSSSSSLILGLVIAAAAGLRNQLVPGLARAAITAQEAAKNSKTFAKEQIEGVQVARKAATAQAYAALESKKNFDYLGKSGPKAYQAVAASVRAGTASIEEQEAAIKSLNRSYKANETVLKKPAFAPDTAKGQAKLQEQQNIRNEIAAIQGLQAARVAADTADVNSASRVQKARLAARVASREALAQNAAAASIGAASQLQLGEAWKQLTLSVKAYGSAQTLASAEGSRAMVVLRTSAFAAATAVRTIGVAFLAALPYLGLVVTALGLINAGMEALKSDKTKALEAAFNDLSESTSKTEKYSQELIRSQNAIAPAALRVAQAITIQSNAVSETADKFNEVIRVSNQFNEVTGEMKTGISGFFDTLSTRGIASYTLQVDKASKALDVFGNNMAAGGTATMFGGQSVTDPVFAAAIKSLDSVMTLAPKATSQLARYYGGWDAIMKLPYDQKLTVVNRIINEAAAQYKDAAGNVTALQEAFKALDQSIGDFTLGSIQTTQYDQVVKGFDSVTASIMAFKEASVVSGDGSWQQLLTGIGPGITKFLDVATQKQLESFRLSDQTVQSLKKQQASAGAIADEESKRARLATGLFASIDKQLASSRLLFINAQQQQREYKSQLDLLNAHIQANQALYAAAGAGLKARINREEQVRGIQAAQIKSEMTIQQISIERAKLRLEELEAQKAIYRQNALIIAQETERTKSAFRQRLADSNVSVIAVENGLTGGAYAAREGNNPKTKQVAELIDQYRYFNDNQSKAGKDALDREREILTIQNAIRDGQSAINNLQTQLNVLAEQGLTSAQKLAQIREADVAFQNQLQNTLKEQRSIVQSIMGDYEDVSAIITGNNDSLRYQLTILERSAAAQRSAVISQSNMQITNLKAQRDTAKAAADRAGLDADEKEAGRVLVRNIEDQIKLQEQQQTLDVARIDSQTALNVAQKVYFDTMREGLDWQRTALDMVQKQLDAQRNISDEIRNQYENGVRLAARRAGLELSPQAEQAIEINAARQTLNLAIQESEVKKAMIDLEYALLEAQRQQLADDLRARKEKLSDDPRNATRIAQLNSTIDRLESVNTKAIANSAKDAIDLNIQNARTALETAMTPKGRGGFFGDLTSVMQGAREMRDQIEAARRDRVKPIEVAPIVAAETIANRDILAQGVTDPIVSSNQLLVEKIDEWIKSVEKMTGATTSSATSSATGRAGQALDFFKKRGYSDAQAAGIVGNLQHESGLRTTAANNVGGGHVGLAQWGKARQREFREKFGKDLINATFEEQLQFIDYELNKYARYGKEQILKSLTAADAATVFNNKFEIPGNDGSLNKRIGYANGYMKAGTPTVATPAAVANDNEPRETLVIAHTSPKIDGSLGSASAADGPLTGKIGGDNDPRFEKAYRGLDVLDAMTAKTKENLAQLGPDGEYVSAVIGGMESITENVLRALEVFDTNSFTSRFTAVAAVAAATLATVQSATSAQARAKEEAVDREITAEQRRDGKSAESVAKIAALEKKKDEIAKKQFNTNKKLMMAQAVIATATGVAQALSYGFPLGPILAGVIGAMGAAQLAIISGTQYQSSSATATAAQGTPASLSIGKRGDTVDLARQNSNVGGELGYLRGREGTGSNSGNYNVIGSAYGGGLNRGYGNTAYSLGEKGPETITMDTPITVRPANDNSNSSAPIDAKINIQALDARGVEEVLMNQRGNLISMLREAANSKGQPFMESINVSEHSRPNSTASRL